PLFFERPSESAYLMNNVDPAALRGGVVHGRWKYQYVAGIGEAGAAERLFDVIEDPGEKYDRIAEHRDEARALKARGVGWLHHFQQRWEAAEGLGPDASGEAIDRTLTAE